MHKSPVELCPFKFRNGRQQVVKGLLIQPRPGQPRSPVGFCYLPGIVLGMAAVHRLGFDIGRRLAEQGHVVCLFDPSGVGESEGDYPSGKHPDIVSWVLGGAFEKDTLEVLEHVANKTGVERFGLIGHCGGAVTSTYVGATSELVAGAFLISPPPCIERDGVVPKQAVEEYFALYRRKLLSVEAWKRLLGGKTSYRTLAEVVLRKARGWMEKSKSIRIAKATPVASVATASKVAKPEPEMPFNAQFVDSISRMTKRGKRLWIVYGDRDPEYADFQRFRTEHLSDEIPVHVLANTSHGFLTEASLEALLTATHGFASELAFALGPMAAEARWAVAFG